MTNGESMTERGSKALETVQQLIELSLIEGDVTVEEDEELIRVEITPTNDEDSNILIGPQGRTLSAYQFIVNRIVNRFPENRKPINIDVSGYVAQHKERLEGLAGRLSDTVVDKDIAVAIMGMNPADRRTMHMAWDDNKDVRSFSNDEGIARRIIVSSQGD